MVVVTIEMWPHGDKEKRQHLGHLIIANDGTGTVAEGNYQVVAGHTGKYRGKRPEPYKTGEVHGFKRILGVYKLIAAALRAIKET